MSVWFFNVQCNLSPVSGLWDVQMSIKSVGQHELVSCVVWLWCCHLVCLPYLCPESFLLHLALLHVRIECSLNQRCEWTRPLTCRFITFWHLTAHTYPPWKLQKKQPWSSQIKAERCLDCSSWCEFTQVLAMFSSRFEDVTTNIPRLLFRFNGKCFISVHKMFSEIFRTLTEYGSCSRIHLVLGPPKCLSLDQQWVGPVSWQVLG